MTDQPSLFDWTGSADAEQSFAAFHAAHPDVWFHFERFTLELIRKGYEHHSADAVLHRVRWETDANADGQPYKIQNNWTAYYARMFHRRHPIHAGFFRTRKSKADEEVAA